MHALEANEVWAWYRDHGMAEEVDALRRHTVRPAVVPELPFCERFEFNTSGNTPGLGDVAEKSLRAVGPWQECLVVHVLWGVWSSAEDWPRFYAWRGRHGVRLSLDDAPGHLFSDDDPAALMELLIQTFEFGWECHALFSSDRSSIQSHVFVSHDGWLTIQSDAAFTF
jgi:hypothetical protein